MKQFSVLVRVVSSGTKPPGRLPPVTIRRNGRGNCPDGLACIKHSNGDASDISSL